MTQIKLSPFARTEARGWGCRLFQLYLTRQRTRSLICIYREASLTAWKHVTDVFVYCASRHGTMTSHSVTEQHGTTQTSPSQSRCITERNPSRAITARGTFLVLSGCMKPCRIIAKWKLVVRQRHSSAVHHRGSQRAMENHGVYRRSRNIMDITDYQGAEPSWTITTRNTMNHITDITACMLNSAVVSRLGDVM